MLFLYWICNYWTTEVLMMRICELYIKELGKTDFASLSLLNTKLTAEFMLFCRFKKVTWNTSHWRVTFSHYTRVRLNWQITRWLVNVKIGTVIPSLCFNLSDSFLPTSQHGWNCFASPVNSWTDLRIKTFETQWLQWAKHRPLFLPLSSSSLPSSVLLWHASPDITTLSNPKSFIIFRESFAFSYVFWSLPLE